MDLPRVIIRYGVPTGPERILTADTKTMTVGRSSRGHPVDLDLTPDMQVSHRHARISWEDGTFWLEDLGSRNGTWVNGIQIVEKTRLLEMDRIQIGQTRIRLEPESWSLFTMDPATPVPHDALPELTPTPVQLPAAQDLPAARDLPAAPDLPAAREPRAESVTHIAGVAEIAEMTAYSGHVAPTQLNPELGSMGRDLRDLRDLMEEEEELEGILASRLNSGEHPSLLILPEIDERHDRTLEANRRRLTAFYNLGAALGMAHDLESIGETIVSHLVNAIPGAQRGALLLKDGRKLLLKAHVPGGDPGASLSLALRAMETREGFIWQDGLPGSPDPSASMILSGTRSAMYAPMIWGGDPLGVVCVDNSANPNAFEEDDLRLLMAMSNHAAMFVRNHDLQQELRHEAALRSSLLRQFSPRVAERLLQDRGRLRLGGERANPVTILVSDVRGFTATSATLDPDDIVQLLNGMYALVLPIIFKHEGTVETFVGDSIVAAFGTPERDDHQCENAVRAALEMQQVMLKLGDLWRIRGMPIWETGIGIHTGEVVAGFIGSSDRMDHTVIGDTVNRASRYCDGAGPGEVLISKAVYEHVYRLVQVSPKLVQSKHPDVEPTLEALAIRELRENEPAH
jgi:adenylate cyclase